MAIDGMIQTRKKQKFKGAIPEGAQEAKKGRLDAEDGRLYVGGLVQPRGSQACFAALQLARPGCRKRRG